jgi:AcrR family transcriptional regulator
MICDLSGVSRVTFYNYFNDKYHLLEEIENELLKSLDSIAQSHISSEMANIKDKRVSISLIEEITQFIDENRAAFVSVLNGEGSRRFVYNWKKNLCNAIKKRFPADVENYTHVNTDAMNDALAASMIALYNHWLFFNVDLGREQINTMAAQLFIRPFYNAKDIKAISQAV